MFGETDRVSRSAWTYTNKCSNRHAWRKAVPILPHFSGWICLLPRTEMHWSAHHQHAGRYIGSVKLPHKRGEVGRDNGTISARYLAPGSSREVWTFVLLCVCGKGHPTILHHMETIRRVIIMHFFSNGGAKRRRQSEGDVFSSNCGAAWSFVTRRRGGVFLEASIYFLNPFLNR